MAFMERENRGKRRKNQHEARAENKRGGRRRKTVPRYKGEEKRR